MEKAGQNISLILLSLIYTPFISSYVPLITSCFCLPTTLLPFSLLELALAHQSETEVDSGELRGLLLSLSPKLDAYSKNMILHGITRCVYLLESEVSVQNNMMYNTVMED